MQGMLEKTVLEPDFPFRLFFNTGEVFAQLHWHEDIEIIYLVEGKLRVGISNKIYQMYERDILFIAPGSAHCFFAEKEFSNRAVIQFRISIFDSFLSGIQDTKTIKPMFNISTLLNPGNNLHTLLEKQINELINEYNNKALGYKLILKARLYDLAGNLLRHMPKNTQPDEEVNNQKEAILRLDKVFQYINENYQNKIDLNDITKAAGLSKYYFTRFFKENVGVTFIDYLNSLRIAKSEHFLMNSNESIIEIAYKCGFNSVKTFNRVFKKIKGSSPVAYKKAITKE